MNKISVEHEQPESLEGYKEYSVMDLAALCCTQSDGETSDSFASLMEEEILTVEDSQDVTVRPLVDYTFISYVLNLYLSEGCAVVELEFADENHADYERCLEIVSQWVQVANESHVLSLLIMPTALNGQAGFMFYNPLYYLGYQDADTKKHKLVLCFNNLDTQVVEDNEIDAAQIAEEVENELKREEAYYHEQLHAVEEEIKQMKQDDNLYQQYITEKYENFDMHDMQKPSTQKSGIRFSDNDADV